jgi:DNA-methyltransferase (dcm)
MVVAKPQKKKNKSRRVAEDESAYRVQRSTEFRFIDLFCGIGGFRLAFERAGCKCVWSCDWDKYARKTYKENFGEEPCGDIHDVAVADIPQHDVLCAGFPCQPFSIAGVSKKISLGRKHGFQDEKQGNLFFEIANIIEFHRPAAFVLENVKHLKRHDGGRTFEIIYNTLTDALGYTVYHDVIDAQAVLPQHRERIFIIGFREWRDFEFPRFEKGSSRLRDILEPQVASKYTLTDHLWKYLKDYAAKHRAAGNGFGYGLFTPDDVARTLSARYYKDGSEILIAQKGNPRRLSPRECARLMGFPNGFEIPVSDTQAYKQFGNSVAVPIVEEIAKCLIKSLRRPLGLPADFALRWSELREARKKSPRRQVAYSSRQKEKRKIKG